VPSQEAGTHGIDEDGGSRQNMVSRHQGGAYPSQRRVTYFGEAEKQSDVTEAKSLARWFACFGDFSARKI